MEGQQEDRKRAPQGRSAVSRKSRCGREKELKGELVARIGNEETDPKTKETNERQDLGRVAWEGRRVCGCECVNVQEDGDVGCTLHTVRKYSTQVDSGRGGGFIVRSGVAVSGGRK